MQVDVLIVGGGIAGLWLLAELRVQGVRALLATDELGKGQTIASQGIIHGGTKYALTGKVTGATLAIGDMPRLWRAALNGEGAVDLRKVKVLAESQLLWTSGGLGSRITGFFASKAMQSRMAAVPRDAYPDLFRHPEFHGGLYRLDEPVLDVPSLLETLREQLADALVQVDTTQSRLNLRAGHYYYEAHLPDGTLLEVMAQQIVLAAGAGNEMLAARFGSDAPMMQRRPLHMVLVRGNLPMLYAHALGMSDKPRATITAHRDKHGKTVWYIGGQPAEQGVGKPAAEVIAATQRELAELLPWVDFQSMAWSTWRVDRAEGCQPDGSRPDQPMVQRFANVTVAWPTKLAFAPLLAARLRKELGVMAAAADASPVADAGQLPTPPVASSIWDVGLAE